jgi:hypothetical protein
MDFLAWRIAMGALSALPSSNTIVLAIDEYGAVMTPLDVNGLIDCLLSFDFKSKRFHRPS